MALPDSWAPLGLGCQGLGTTRMALLGGPGAGNYWDWAARGWTPLGWLCQGPGHHWDWGAKGLDTAGMAPLPAWGAPWDTLATVTKNGLWEALRWA